MNEAFGHDSDMGTRGMRFLRRAQHATGGSGVARSDRFLANKTSQGQSSGTDQIMCQLPLWVGWPDKARETLAGAVAILKYRSAIDRELSGEKLSALAKATGETLFEKLCDINIERLGDIPNQLSLPRPENLADEGHSILAETLPKKNGSAQNSDAAALVASAVATMRASGHSKEEIEREEL